MTTKYMGPWQSSLFARQDIVESGEIARLIEGVYIRRQGSTLLVGAADASQPPRISEGYLDLGLRITHSLHWRGRQPAVCFVIQRNLDAVGIFIPHNLL